MKKADIARFKEVLEGLQAELQARIRKTQADTTETEDSDAPDLGDRALKTMNRDLLNSVTMGERDMLRRMEDALKRIDAGEYGQCTHCGSAVQSGRLEAIPWAKHCVDCQELQDRGEI
jgi:DnaK suppressor protein